MNISGRLTKDATVSKTPTGRQVVNFSIAVNDSYRNRDGERIVHTAFIECAYWRTAKAVAWLSKGLYVELTGQISAMAWIDRQGNPRAGIKFSTATIKPISGKAKKDTDPVKDSTEKKEGSTAPISKESDPLL